MACFSPLQAFRSSIISDNGKRKPVFNPADSISPSSPFNLPCGQCVGCRLERSRQWAVRCVHEASLYEKNCFITLTFSDEHLPSDMSLSVSDFQRFMKRLRKKFGNGIRFYHCGEYGTQFGRPHYHALLFNHDFDDKYLFREERGVSLYRSETLESLWPFGHSSIGDVTFESAAYVARYIMKKVNGDLKDDHYSWIDELTGEVSFRKPEYTTMSRRPGIGKGWLDKYMSDVYPSDEVILLGKNGSKRVRPPKYYDTQFELLYPDEYARLKESREVKAEAHAANNSEERLAVREQVQLAKLRLLKRTID